MWSNGKIFFRFFFFRLQNYAVIPEKRKKIFNLLSKSYAGADVTICAQINNNRKAIAICVVRFVVVVLDINDEFFVLFVDDDIDDDG